MRLLLKALQALGIAVTGYGLMMGVAAQKIGQEYLYAIVGIVLFYVARFVEVRLPER
jgi:hypothetical protein